MSLAQALPGRPVGAEGPAAPERSAIFVGFCGWKVILKMGDR